jgi:two-component system response regulator NreC
LIKFKKGNNMPTSSLIDHSPRISQREIEILRLIAEGYGEKEVAEDLHMSLGKVKFYQTHLMEKLSCQDISLAIGFALRKGLITIYEILESRYGTRNKNEEG